MIDASPELPGERAYYKRLSAAEMLEGQERAAFEAEIQKDAQIAWERWQDQRNELSALRRDAARYRWLRAQTWHESEFCVVQHPKRTVRIGTYCPSDELLDSVIDTLIGLAGQEKKE